MLLLRALVILVCVRLSAAVRILSEPPLNCSRQGLKCVISTTNCMDRGWLRVDDYTPSRPEGLQVSVTTRRDVTGQLQPVLVSNWTIQDDGSIGYLTATELHVLVITTNENFCVRYSFKDKLPMRNPDGEKWLFSANMLVLDPGQRYRVTVFNIPKPRLGHSSYDISTDVDVDGCQDRTMQLTQFCIDRGSLWHPNISLAPVSAAGGRPALTVSFSPDRLCEEYIVIVSCANIQHVDRTYKVNQTTLNATFSLDKWPKFCCQFDVAIKPLFPRCGEDCSRRRKTLDVCPGPVTVKSSDAPDVLRYSLVSLGGFFMFMCVVVVIKFVTCSKPGKPGGPAAAVRDEEPKQLQIQQAPKVLVIYSQDHRLYRDVVLKLCAFLQAKCGTKVLVDLLDTTSVGMVGRLRWLEWQRQQMNNPSDKILVLCSRGVQAKWRAMCGHGRVTLREDVLSPTDDMLTPFLNLFLPDMHQAGMLGRYMVAYFNDISSERDVPSVFDIAVKYKLMKHFEELYFRILDMEKYQPGQVNSIEGVGGDEYFNCPSGRALKDAIQTFQAHQLENPHWFEEECVNSEEEVLTEADLLIDQLPGAPVLECLPLIRGGLPVHANQVEINENVNSVHHVTPELNPERQLSVAELTPMVNSGREHLYPWNLDDTLAGHLHPHRPQSVCVAEPVLINPPPSRQNWFWMEEEHVGQTPVEHEEEAPLSAQPTPPASNHPHPCGGRQEEDSLLSGRAVELDEEEVLEPDGKTSNSGSDQGYGSKLSSQLGQRVIEDPMAALARLQEELLHNSL